MGFYSITHQQNTLAVKLEGNFEPDYIAKFVQEFQSEVQKLQPASTELELTVNNFQVLGSDKQDGLKSCLEMYQKIGFKKVILNLGSNAILSMQVNRLAKSAGLENFEII